MPTESADDLPVPGEYTRRPQATQHRIRQGILVEEKFWETGAKVVDFEDTKESSPTSHLLAKLICLPLFFFAAVVVPIDFLLSSDGKMILAGILFFALPYALVPLAIYGVYASLQTDHTLRISTMDEIGRAHV